MNHDSKGSYKHRWKIVHSLRRLYSKTQAMKFDIMQLLPPVFIERHIFFEVFA